jgi:hypothetical protein
MGCVIGRHSDKRIWMANADMGSATAVSSGHFWGLIA